MSLNYSKGLFNEWEIAIAKKYVRQFRSTCQCLERDFEDDLVDECLKHWYFLRDTVKPEAEEKRRAYMVAIVRNKLSDIVREHTSKKRNEFFQAISLNQFLENNSDSPFLAHPSQQDPADEADLPELKSKLDQVFKKLNPQQQKVYSALCDGQLTITEMSVCLKLHRNTIRNEINRIRKVFESEGFREFLR